jgi:hypothetical protein
MDLPAGKRLYLVPNRDLAGRVWVVPMNIKVYVCLSHGGTVLVDKNKQV